MDVTPNFCNTRRVDCMSSTLLMVRPETDTQRHGVCIPLVTHIHRQTHRDGVCIYPWSHIYTETRRTETGCLYTPGHTYTQRSWLRTGEQHLTTAGDDPPPPPPSMSRIFSLSHVTNIITRHHGHLFYNHSENNLTNYSRPLYKYC